ncbi:MAG: hypothetical protein ACXWXO_09000 [Nocardioides sp.]
MAPRSTHRLVSLVTAALAVTLLAGCGTTVDLDSERADSPVAKTPRPKKTPKSPAPTTESAPSPSASPSEDVVEEQPDDSANAPATLPARLLAAEEYPGPNRSFLWTEGRTTKREPAALAGTCHQFSMLSIGAMRVAHRDYLPADASPGARANELVATFADKKTAWRAFEVLKSWRAECDEALAKYDRHDVGELAKVSLGNGEGHWYLLSYGPAEGETDAGYFDAEGIALVGNRIAVLRMAVIGQDYDYPAGKEPMVATVRAAAAKLL